MVSLLLMVSDILARKLTPACIDWESTLTTLDTLNAASLKRREVLAQRESRAATPDAVQRLKTEA